MSSFTQKNLPLRFKSNSHVFKSNEILRNPPNSQKSVQSISASERQGETSTPKLLSQNELSDFICVNLGMIKQFLKALSVEVYCFSYIF